MILSCELVRGDGKGELDIDAICLLLESEKVTPVSDRNLSRIRLNLICFRY